MWDGNEMQQKDTDPCQHKRSKGVHRRLMSASMFPSCGVKLVSEGRQSWCDERNPYSPGHPENMLAAASQHRALGLLAGCFPILSSIPPFVISTRGRDLSRPQVLEMKGFWPQIALCFHAEFVLGPLPHPEAGWVVAGPEISVSWTLHNKWCPQSLLHPLPPLASPWGFLWKILQHFYYMCTFPIL